MNTLATVTVIRGKGECDLIINDIRDKEVHRINELHAEEMELVKNELKRTKDCMTMMPVTIYKKERLAGEFIKLRFGEFAKPSVLRRIRDGIEFVWACIWYCGLKLGLWGYWDDEEDE